MKTIWKYEVNPDGRGQTHRMPKGATILTVQMQGPAVCVWALVDPGAQDEERTFHIYGTGHAIVGADGLRYIGTFQPNDGGSPLVFHLFELLPSLE